MKRLSIVLTVVVALGILVINLWPEKSPASVPPTPIRIAMSTTPLSAPLIIAKELALFKHHDVDVELIPYQGGHLCFDAMINGDADLATSSESVVMFNSFKRNNFRLLASFVESDNDLKLLSFGKQRNADGRDFNNKRIGMIKSSASEFFTDSLLIITGQENSSFEKVYMSPQELAPALIAGEVDFISIWEPYGYHLIKDQGSSIYQYPSKGIYNLSFNLISTDTNTKVHFEQHVKILKALAETQQFIAEHPKQAKKIISDYLNIPDAELEWAWNDYIFRLSLNNSLLSMLHTQARWAIASGAVSSPMMPDFRILMDDSALLKAMTN
ncbi:ABC transporter substrate-binding protein [Shewanella psychrotolerans]|uniref:ABC transporter substrate-binding protein n=1 Tax=Shewanella psychrotolerans TaxID=2864206 RepID=UPI001C661B01|nr:ABC transporter substrate-binding protein [Shewanella psychrotolerans]QYJ99985.1 ABC transporter substrate-binding protein [Shewanella psychrotolerans]